MQNYEEELKSQIIEDIERLKEDVNELIKNRKQNQFSDFKSGIICPKCSQVDNHTTDSRIKKEFRVRDRVCDNCGKKWSTIEIVW